MTGLTGRVALVTGAAGHLGRAICEALASLGCSVVATDREPDVLSEWCAASPDARWALAVDLSDEAAVRRLPATIVGRWQRLDVVVNNAAFVGTSNLPGWNVPLSDQSAETWRSCLEVNLTAPFILSQESATYLASGGCGVIVNISSIYGLLGPDPSLYEGTQMGNPAAYGASKAALLQLTRHFATMLAPDVRVNAVCPGGIARGQPRAFVERYERRTPLGRMATEEDVVGAVVYLASDMSRYVTGQTLVVDGGWSIW